MVRSLLAIEWNFLPLKFDSGTIIQLHDHAYTMLFGALHIYNAFRMPKYIYRKCIFKCNGSETQRGHFKGSQLGAFCP